MAKKYLSNLAELKQQQQNEIDAYNASRVGKPGFIDYFKNSTLRHPMDDILEIVKKLTKTNYL